MTVTASTNQAMRSTIAATLLLVTGLPVLAGITTQPSFEEPLVTAPAEPSEWRVHLALYAWLQSLDGDITTGGNTVPLSLDFDDITDYLDMSLMGAFGVNYGRWGFLLDMNYAELSTNLPTPLGIAAPFVSFKQEQWLVNAVGSYALVRNGVTELDVYAGLRLNALDVDLGVNAITLGGSQEWIDPIIGLRFQQQLSSSFFFRAIGDIGGFGVSSDFTWQAMAAFGWQFSECGSFLLGYRAVDTDYEQGGFAWDVNAHGPILGLEFGF